MIDWVVSTFAKDEVEIVWTMYYACNFACSYCIQNPKKSEKVSMELKGIVNTAKKLNTVIENSKIPIKLRIRGGEPTLIDLVPVLTELSSSWIVYIAIETNTSAPIQYYDNLLAFFNKVKIWCSFHEDQPLQFEEYVQKVNTLATKHSKDRIRSIFLVDSDNYFLYDKLKEKCICEVFSCEKVIDRELPPFTESTLNALVMKRFKKADILYSQNGVVKRIPHKIFRWKKPDFYGYYCKSNKFSLVQNSIRLRVCPRSPVLVPLTEDLNFRDFLKTPILCDAHHCHFNHGVIATWKAGIEEPNIAQLKTIEVKETYTVEEMLQELKEDWNEN